MVAEPSTGDSIKVMVSDCIGTCIEHSPSAPRYRRRRCSQWRPRAALRAADGGFVRVVQSARATHIIQRALLCAPIARVVETTTNASPVVVVWRSTEREGDVARVGVLARTRTLLVLAFLFFLTGRTSRTLYPWPATCSLHGDSVGGCRCGRRLAKHGERNTARGAGGERCGSNGGNGSTHSLTSLTQFGALAGGGCGGTFTCRRLS